MMNYLFENLDDFGYLFYVQADSLEEATAIALEVTGNDKLEFIEAHDDDLADAYGYDTY